ncbi:hypothetical protein LNI89_08040 [Tenacibaculum dicentrarchi]|nr:hypothetical protein [Tenacibaculum dicentrarchi]MCD8420434.1 hypothetical protein [Tenacibaculum dicentrarchi]
MIDGVNIEVNKSPAQKWFENSYLDFSYHDSVNAENYNGAFYLAKYWGLHFIVWVDKKNDLEPYKLEVKGSLHRYYNKGKHNYNDFTIEQLKAVLVDLETKFNINPNTVILHGFEIGVNIHIPIAVNELLKNLVVFKNNEFIPMRIGSKGRRQTVGKIIEQQRQTQKYYDKGKEFNLKSKNLARFELSFDRMQGVKDAISSLVKSKAVPQLYEIKNLTDLADLSKIKPLINCLVDRWLEIIYYDKSINIRCLSNEEKRRRYIYLGNPRNWIDYNKEQRRLAKKRLARLMNKHGSTTQKEISVLIANKWNELTAENVHFLTGGTTDKNQHQKNINVHFLTVNIHGYKVDIKSKTNTTNKTPKSPQKAIVKKRICKSCENDISHKRVSAKYCSKKCNNKANGIIRTMKNRKRIVQEKQDLIRLLKLLSKNKIWLMISYKTDSGIYTDTLKQSEIKTSKDWIKSVQKVLVTEHRKNAPPIILNSYRARKLLSEINTRNGI